MKEKLKRVNFSDSDRGFYNIFCSSSIRATFLLLAVQLVFANGGIIPPKNSSVPINDSASDDVFFTLELAKPQLSFVFSNGVVHSTKGYVGSENKDVNESDENSVENLINNIKNKLDLLKKKLGGKGSLSKGAKNVLIDDCIEDILKEQFEEAQKKLIQIDNDNDIVDITKKAYKNQEPNFDAVLKFGDYLYSEKNSFLIYSTLNSEIEKNQQNITRQLVKLAKSLREKFIDAPCSAPELKKKASDIEKNSITKIKEIASEKLKASILQGNYHTTQALSNQILELGYALYDEIMTKVMHNVYGKITTEQLLNDISKYESIDQKFVSYASVLDEMHNSEQLNNNSALFKLAYHIKNEISSLSNRSKPTNKYELLKSQLPASVKSAVFSSEICLKNVHMNEYVYAAGFYHNNDSAIGRSLFTWIPGGRGSSGRDQSKWTLIHTNDDVFRLKNAEFPNDYLFASDIELYPSKRITFTHPVSEPLTNNYLWKIIPQGDNVYLKNVQYSDYLLADVKEKKDNDRRYVFTSKPAKITSEYEWKIESCW